MKTKRNYYASALQAAGLDLKKDFFSLTYREIDIVDNVRRSFGYNYRSPLGRSVCRSFWYAAQKAVK